MNGVEEVFRVLKPFEVDLVQALKRKAVANFDKTGMRCEGKLHWLHSASDSELTFFGIHQKRGAAAVEEFGILPNFKGIAVYDHWDSCFTFKDCQHALCNSPVLRELNFVAEEKNESWAADMHKLLIRIHKKVQQQKSRGRKNLSKCR